MSDASEEHPDLTPLLERLEAVVQLVRRIANEAGDGLPRSANALIERHRPEVYAAMEALGLAVHDFERSRPSAEQLADAQNRVIGTLRAISLTSPVAFYGAQGKKRRLSYYELVRHVRAGKTAGVDVAARVLDDYYVHTRLGEAFLNRLNLLAHRLADHAARYLGASEDRVHLISLQYIGGDELLPLAHGAATGAGLQVTCLDDNVDAVRDAEQRLRPAFGSRLACLKADPVVWLHGASCPSNSVCLVYAASLLEQLSLRRAVRVLEGVHRVLRPGGILLIGATAGNPPVAEQMIRYWLLGWDWKYRSELEWREIFSQTPFGEDSVSFEYEPLGINALIRVEKRAS